MAQRELDRHGLQRHLALPRPTPPLVGRW
jgi:hypothetical protein